MYIETSAECFRVHTLSISSTTADIWQRLFKLISWCYVIAKWTPIRHGVLTKYSFSTRWSIRYLIDNQCDCWHFTKDKAIHFWRLWYPCMLLASGLKYEVITRPHFYQTRSAWSVDQGSTKKCSAVYNFVPTVTKFCVMWEGLSLPHDTKFGNCRGEIVDRRVIFIWSLIHGSSWSGLIKVGPGCPSSCLINKRCDYWHFTKVVTIHSLKIFVSRYVIA